MTKTIETAAAIRSAPDTIINTWPKQKKHGHRSFNPGKHTVKEPSPNQDRPSKDASTQDEHTEKQDPLMTTETTEKAKRAEGDMARRIRGKGSWTLRSYLLGNARTSWSARRGPVS